MTGARRVICGLLAMLAVVFSTLPACALEVPEPTLSPDAATYDAEHPELLEEDQLYAVSAILIEANSGMVIFEKNADQVMYPASTTKIMTALLALMCGDLDMTCTVSAEAITFYEDDVSTADLREGEQLSLRDLLYATLVQSANDAANVVAESVSGSISDFVNLMNEAAVTFGCTSTHFVNPHGLHDDSHYTTARDMAIITREALKDETFREMVSTTSYTCPRTNLVRARTWTNSNRLMIPSTSESTNKYYYPDAIGVKTGTTSKAGYCFVGAAERDGVELISVVFFTGQNARWADTIKLMNYGFSQYISVTPIDLYNMNPISIETTGFSLDDVAMGTLSLSCVPQDINATATIIATQDEVDLMASNLRETVLIEYSRDFVAPIQAGEVMGTMTYFPEDGDPVVYNLLANRSVAKRENAPLTLEEIVAMTEADPNPFPPLTLEMVLYLTLPFLFLWLMIRIMRKLIRRRRVHNARMPKIKNRYLK
ncbi:MAG: D-alanyl-D-alanine carboxypeptidase family protein [Aristaeellaceae bacterium]